ncbi:hypothetical protein J6590_046355 [Homalodisca vitripennis]|nr:hypothetical protein J6590_046355 [Homalodisca vitripennis]
MCYHYTTEPSLLYIKEKVKALWCNGSTFTRQVRDPGSSPGGARIRADILSASSRSHIEAMQVAISPNAPSGQKPVRPDIHDLGSRLFAAGQAYVALSLVSSLDGILIEELDCSKLTGNTPRNSEALNEMMRLRNDSKEIPHFHKKLIDKSN